MERPILRVRDRRSRPGALHGLAVLAIVHVVLSGAASAQPPVSSAPGPIDPAGYANELRSLSDALQSADTGALANVQRRVPAVWNVRVGERTVDVPGVWIQRRLRDAQSAPELWPSIKVQLIQQLSSAARDADSLRAGAVVVDSARVRASLDEVLARPEFAQMARETALMRMQTRVVEWVRKWWARLGGDQLPVRSTATVFAWAASLAAIAVLAGWVVHSLRRAGRLPRPLPEPAGRRRVPAHVWAQRAVAAEDLREAARCTYRAAVSCFEEDGTWRVDEARTPREYVRLLPRDHRGRPILEDVARRFEEIWFGGRPATTDDRGSLVRSLRELGCLPAE